MPKYAQRNSGHRGPGNNDKLTLIRRVMWALFTLIILYGSGFLLRSVISFGACMGFDTAHCVITWIYVSLCFLLIFTASIFLLLNACFVLKCGLKKPHRINIDGYESSDFEESKPVARVFKSDDSTKAEAIQLLHIPTTKADTKTLSLSLRENVSLLSIASSQGNTTGNVELWSPKHASGISYENERCHSANDTDYHDTLSVSNQSSGEDRQHTNTELRYPSAPLNSQLSFESSFNCISHWLREGNFPVDIPVPTIDQLQKNYSTGLTNITSTYVASALSQTDRCGGDVGMIHSESKPIFSESWQGAGSFQSAGGSLTMTDSDVRLEILANAVPPGVYADIVMATYTDLPQVRQKLNLAQHYVIMSPVVEFHASGIQQFDRPVHIFLPHGLPLSFPEEQVRIYHLHRGQDGVLQVSLVPPKAMYEELCKNNDTHYQSDPGLTGDEETGLQYGPGYFQSEPGLTRDEETGLQYGPGYFQLLPCGELIVTTVRFCAYVCVACGQGVDQLPELHLMAVSPPLLCVESLWQAEVFLYLWDRKITIRDFQRDHVVRGGVAVDKTLDLVDDFLTSLVTMELTLRGADRDVWQQVKREDSQELLFPTSQQFPLKKLLHCQARESPKKKQWLVESVRHQDTSPTLQCYIDITNVSTSQPAEQYRETLFVKNTGNNITQRQVGAESRSADETRKKLNTDRPNNTWMDTARRATHTASLSVQPVALVSNTPPGVQEHNSDMDTRLLYGSGINAENQDQLDLSGYDPRQALLPQNRNTPTNLQSCVLIDNLKQHRLSLFPRRQGQEHDEYGELLCPMSTSCPDLHLSASARRDQVSLTVQGTSGRELMQQRHLREPLPQETRSQGVGDQAGARSPREDRDMGDVGTEPMTSDVRQQDPRQVNDGSQHGDHASMPSQQQSVLVPVSLHRATDPPSEGQGGTRADLTVPTSMCTGGAFVLPDNSLGGVCVPSPTPSHERPASFDDGTTR